MILSKNEYWIMELLWNAEKPLSRHEILMGTEGRKWNPSSIHLILNSMLSKGVIKISDEEKRYARTYEAIISQEQYVAEYVAEGMPGTSTKNLLRYIVNAFVNHNEIDCETIEDLEELLKLKKEEVKKGNCK